MGERLLHGARPYVDFVLPIPPGSFVVMAAIQAAAGKAHLIQELWVAAVCHLLMALLAYTMARPITTRANALAVSAATLATVVQLYREHSAALTEPLALDPTFYRDLIARRAAGTLGAMETTLDPILGMIAITDSLANGPVPAVARALAEAQVARDDAERASRLAEARAQQQQIEQGLAQLLLRLEEWNDYQDLVQEVRALRDRQQDLQNRTEEARGK